MVDLIICANFSVDKLRGYRELKQSLVSDIKTAGYLCNSVACDTFYNGSTRLFYGFLSNDFEFFFTSFGDDFLFYFMQWIKRLTVSFWTVSTLQFELLTNNEQAIIFALYLYVYFTDLAHPLTDIPFDFHWHLLNYFLCFVQFSCMAFLLLYAIMLLTDFHPVIGAKEIIVIIWIISLIIEEIRQVYSFSHYSVFFSMIFPYILFWKRIYVNIIYENTSNLFNAV